MICVIRTSPAALPLLLALAGAPSVALPVAALDGPTHGTFTSSDGLSIHYMEQGEGVPVVLIHGYTGSAEGNWFSNGVAAEIAGTHRAIAIDCRGHGRSDKPHDPKMYGPEMARDVVELMDHLGLEKAHLHGYSMGGGIVTQMLARWPERMITATYGGSGVPEVDPEWIAKLSPDAEGEDPQEEEARSTLRSSPTRDDEALAAVREYPWEEGERTAIDLHAVKVPVLALVGEHDRPNARLTRMKRELSDFESVILPGKSHLTAIMAGYIPQEYIDTFARFVREHDA
ncbi:MAG TPA: alpha/beta hydrolase [Thermoanaerobaculia bacterium]|nr:alpha/beta hydrolase [Thermoanaerobaculia bacterium]